MTNGSSNIRVKLSAKDRGHLEALKSALEFDGPIHDRTENLGEKTYESVSIVVTSPRLVADLEHNYSITARKTYNLKPPAITDPEQLTAYIAGYIDGDGTVGMAYAKSSTSYLYPYISVVGASQALFEWLDATVGTLIEDTRSHLYTRHRKWFCVWHRFLAAKLAGLVLALPIPVLERKWGKLCGLPTERKAGITAAGVRKRAPIRKLQPHDFEEIRLLLKSEEMNQTQIGNLFGVTPTRIGQIKKCLLEGYLKERDDYVDTEEAA